MTQFDVMVQAMAETTGKSVEDTRAALQVLFKIRGVNAHSHPFLLAEVSPGVEKAILARLQGIAKQSPLARLRRKGH